MKNALEKNIVSTTTYRGISMTDLFSPLRIGTLTLKNRFMMAPMENGMAHRGGLVSERLVGFFRERAQKEAAIIMTGSISISPEGAGLPSQIGIYDDRFLPGLEKLCCAVHDAGGRIGAQLYHAGRQATEAVTGLTPLAPSALPCAVVNSHPREVSESDMDELEQKFILGARRAMDAGFDLIEVHFAHGYLLHSFLSPHSNKRTDSFGGSLENRCRFPMRVLRSILKEAAGRVPVTIRISAEEFLEDGLHYEEVRRICLMAQEAGVSAVSLSAGSYDALPWSIQPMFIPRGFLVPYSQKLKQEMNIPVIVAGRLNNASLIRDIITSGKADMVAIGRGLLADEDLILKMKNGRDEDIRYCVACNQGCVDGILSGRAAECLVNARCSFETERQVEKSPRPGNVVIIGGGPAGMECARVAALRGHTVTLCDADPEAGGKLAIVAAPPEKESFLLYRQYLQRQLEELGVQRVKAVIHGPEDIQPYQPDHVVLATGARQSVPPIPGSDHSLVAMAEDILSGKKKSGQNAVVIGGGLVGVETALFLGAKGIRVSILEMADAIARDCGATFTGHIKEELDRCGAQVSTGAAISSIEPDGVICNGEKLPADTVIIAAGYRPDQSLLEGLKSAFGSVHVIGDALSPRRIQDATREGFLCACSL